MASFHFNWHALAANTAYRDHLLTHLNTQLQEHVNEKKFGEKDDGLRVKVLELSFGNKVIQHAYPCCIYIYIDVT